MHDIEEIKKAFRDGQRNEALQRCEALCLSHPKNLELKRLCALMHGMMGNYGDSGRVLKEVLAIDANDAEALFNLGVCERKQLNLSEAERHFLQYTRKFPKQVDGWVNLAECQFQMNSFTESLRSAKAALSLNPASIQAWITQGDCFRALKRYEEALKSYTRANQLQPNAIASLNQGVLLLEVGRYSEAVDCLSSALRVAPNLLAALSNRADAFNYLGRTADAINDYRQVLLSKPDDEEVLKKISICLVNLNRGGEAIQLFRNALEVHPSLLTAKLGITWVLSQMIPAWHLPMMNEWDRNNAYYLGMQSAIAPGKSVLEIGTGSGLLSMMAAKLGAGNVVTCEAVSLLAETAQNIIEHNKYQNCIRVLPKRSFELEVGKDLPEKADILIHEIFSSELIAEHVLPAIEDAKHRLLKPGARIVPAAASIMIALVGGDDVGKYLHVENSFGFDLQQFNAVTPKKIPLYREDLNPQLLSDDVEAFRFDFMNEASFPRQDKTLEIVSTAEGLCYGVIQWIRMEFDEQVCFENHPSHKKSVSNWQRTVFCFDEPIHVKPGLVVSVSAAHDRAAPWFDRVRR
jgi:type II protein arginine methyltransferase